MLACAQCVACILTSAAILCSDVLHKAALLSLACACLIACACQAEPSVEETPIGTINAALADAEQSLAKQDCLTALAVVRRALLSATIRQATNDVVALARLLHCGATALGQIGRYADAESWLWSANALARSDMIEADLCRWRAQRAILVQDWSAVAHAAERAINLNPDCSASMFHCLALSQAMRGEHRAAMDTWLLGLHGMPLDCAPDYLDTAMCFWKPMTEQDIVRFYAGLRSLCRPMTQSNTVQLARILRECVKLQTLYPDRFCQESPSQMLASAVAWPSDLCRDASAWYAVSNPSYAVDHRILHTKHWESSLNQALLLMTHLDDGHQPNNARAILDQIIDKSLDCTGRAVLVEGWSVAALAHALRAPLEGKCGSDARTQRRATSAADYVLATALPRGDCGSLERLFQLQAWRWLQALAHRRSAVMDEANQSMRALFPNSALYDIMLLARTISTSRDPSNSVAQSEALLMRPVGALIGAQLWLTVAGMYDMLTLRTADELAQNWRHKKINLLLSALEHCTQYGLPRPQPISSTRPRRLNLDPFYGEVARALSQQDVAQAARERLAAFLEWYGATIPAIETQAQLICDIRNARQSFAAMQRLVPFDLTIICDTINCRTSITPYIWSDVDGLQKAMLPCTDDRYWSMHYTMPVERQVVHYSLFTGSTNNTEATTLSTIHIRDNPTHSLSVTNTLPREWPVIALLSCDTYHYRLSTNVCVFGNLRSLGQWHARGLIRMSDDGVTHGDGVAGDGVFTSTVEVPAGTTEFDYLFTDGMAAGEWGAGAPRTCRKAAIPPGCVGTAVFSHVFGERIR